MKNKRALIAIGCAVGLLTLTWIIYSAKKSNRIPTDEALLSLIKNDREAFLNALNSGLNIHDSLPEIDGKTYSVAEGVAYFERDKFAKLLREKKISYLKQNAEAEYDVMTITVKKNNSDLMAELVLENPQYALAYGKKGWNLLHMASAWCSHKVIQTLHEKGKLNWNQKAKSGETPLTLAAESECLPILSYWKTKDADFRAKDGRGRSALSILRTKKDPALLAFADSFETRAVAAVAVIPDFYKKRKIPKDQIVDHAAMIEPEDRPLEATETAENSEFAD